MLRPQAALVLREFGARLSYSYRRMTRVKVYSMTSVKAYNSLYILNNTSCIGHCEVAVWFGPCPLF